MPVVGVLECGACGHLSQVDYESTDPLAGIEFQKRIERKAFEAGGGRWEVPAQNLMDFLREGSPPA